MTSSMLRSSYLLRRAVVTNKCVTNASVSRTHHYAPITACVVMRPLLPNNGSNHHYQYYQKHHFQSTSFKPLAAATTTTVTNTSSSSKGTSSTGKISIWYPILGGLVITIGGGLKYFYDEVSGGGGNGLEGLKRSLNFYSYAIPKYFIYRYHMWNKSPNEVWDELDRITSSQGLDKALELNGFYVKAGQMVSSNIGNAFPPIWQDTMSVLEDQVPAQSFETIKKIVQNELDFDNVFESFEEQPIGSASIGQVHRATLKDGTKVVVKVRYPDIEKILRGDVRTIKLFAQVAQPVHVPPLEEIEKQFMTEFDYRKEGQQLDTVRKNLIDAGLANEDNYANGVMCAIPKPYLEYCTERVLVMEELFGDKLSVELKREIKTLAQNTGQSIEDYIQQQRLQERFAKEHGQELQGPSPTQYDQFIKMMDTKRKIKNAGKMIYNYTVGLLPSKETKVYEDKSVLPSNHAKMIDDLIYIHGHEILVNGYFNGDPHPGNILMIRTNDGSPKLGLIDYGQVKSISKNDRHLFCKIIIALANNNRSEIIQLTKQAGFISKNMDDEVIYLYAKLGYDEDNDALTGGKHIQMFMEDLQARDPIQEIPKEYIMASRASIMLRGLAHALHQPRSVAKLWKPIAEKVLEEDI